MFEYSITSMEFSGGESVLVERDSLIIIIGANSAGKSHTIRDISNQVRRNLLGLNEKSTPYDKIMAGVGQSNVNTVDELTVVKSLETYSQGSQYDIHQWLVKHYQLIKSKTDTVFATHTISRHLHSSSNNQVSEGEVLKTKNFKEVSSKLSEFIVRVLDTETRLSLAESVDSINIVQESPKYAIHILQRDKEKEKLISDEVRNAFGKDLIINRGRGQKIGFHVGDSPDYTKEEDRVSPEYLEKLGNIPKLEAEGDGLRSFVGCLLEVVCGGHKILLIDEPEAFLHPPQARMLGQLLATSAKNFQRQIIVATHSSDFVKGAMSSSGKVSVLRINRTGNVNHAHILNSKELHELWNKPILKSLHAVEGIFHRGVIVCEADSDCRFYESLLMRLEQNGEFSSVLDIYFTHGGGKDQLATLAQSYKRLKVPVAVIADFDVLRDKNKLKKLVEAIDGDFAKIEKQYHNFANSIGQGSIKNPLDYASELFAVAQSIQSTKTVSSTDRKKLNDILEDSKDWSEAKKFGIDALKGGSYQDCEYVLNELKKCGIFVVPTGEMESWKRGLSSDKQTWINDALLLVDSDKMSFTDASEFVSKIATFLENN